MAWIMSDRETSTSTAIKDGDVLGREGSIAFPQMAQMSRKHCKIIIEDDACFIMDLGSKNGTMLDGRKLEPNVKIPVRDGSALAFGEKIVRLQMADKTRTQITSTMQIKLEESTTAHLTSSPSPSQAQSSNSGKRSHPFSFTGSTSELFSLIIKNLLFTIVTLGIYIPWARISIRRYIWKSTSLDKRPFQFKGNPQNLLKGYAIVLIAILVVRLIEDKLQSMIPPSKLGAHAMFGIVNSILLFFIYTKIKWKSYVYLVNNSAYRNIKFRVKGEAGAEYLKASIPMVYTLGLYYQWWIYESEMIKWNNTYFGNDKFSYTPNKSEFLSLWLKGLIITILTLGLYYPWFMVSLHRYRMNNLKFLGATFQSNAKGAEYLLVLLKSFFILVLSLGTAAPYVFNLNLAYFLKNLTLKGNIDFDQIIQSVVKTKDGSIFDSAADVLDVDTGLDFI